MTIHTYIFSFNRGKTLLNLIHSAEHIKWRHPITIYDDCSNDEYTKEVLKQLIDKGYEIRYSERKTNHRLGGLYKNMSIALHEAREDIVMFLQDDMQFIREVSEEEICRIHTLLKENKSPFLFPLFFTNTWSITPRTKYNLIEDTYSITPPFPYGGASDVCIFNRKRLLNDGWKQFTTEQESDEIACRSYGSMTVYPDPFVAFIPFPPIPRMNIIKRIVASRGVLGIIKFEIMNENENSNFKKRDKTKPPIDLSYLTITNGKFFRLIKKIIGVRY